MKRHTAEAELLERALDAFREATGIRVFVDRANIARPYDTGPDALIRLETHDGEKEFAVEVKGRLTEPAIGPAIHNLRLYPRKGLLITHHVNPRMAERLKDMGIGFIDTAGNAYINEPPLFIYMKGRKPPEALNDIRPTRAFQPTGLKVIFAFLCNPAFVRAPYREIARAAGVALGTVGWVVRDLKEMGYLFDMGRRGRELIRQEKLLNRWTAAYPERLRPKLVIGRFTNPNMHWWREVQIRDFGAYWGGELAATRLTHYLKPERITIYAREMPGRLLLTSKLRKDPKGNIEILNAFWHTDCDWHNEDVVHPILVYADLLATGDPRAIETATIIYEQELGRLIRED